MADSSERFRIGDPNVASIYRTAQHVYSAGLDYLFLGLVTEGGELFSGLDGRMRFVRPNRFYTLGLTGWYKNEKDNYWQRSELQSAQNEMQRHYPTAEIRTVDINPSRSKLLIRDAERLAFYEVVWGWGDKEARKQNQIREMEAAIQNNPGWINGEEILRKIRESSEPQPWGESLGMRVSVLGDHSDSGYCFRLAKLVDLEDSLVNWQRFSQDVIDTASVVKGVPQTGIMEVPLSHS